MRNSRRHSRRVRPGRYALSVLVGGAMVAVVVAQWPEIQRFAKIMRM